MENMCAETCLFLYDVLKKKLKALSRWYKNFGLTPRTIAACRSSKNTLAFEDVTCIVTFIGNYAEKNALVLPGRVASHARDDIKQLPSSVTKADIYRQYEASMISGQFWYLLIPLFVYCGGSCCHILSCSSP